jgi:predicted pPIWI-associating nuclease
VSQVDAWDDLWSEFDALRPRILASSAININADVLRNRVRLFVQAYFRNVRPELINVGIADDVLASLDVHMQRLIELSQGRNAKTTYVRTLRSVQQERTRVLSVRERLIGERSVRLSIRHGERESRILETLAVMLPDSARSYEQALLDLRDRARTSWRGTAVELREAVREVLDHLAPDTSVMAEAGFKLEKDRKAPTMKQKATFVLRSRGLSASRRRNPQEAVTIVDELTASFVRSIYERGSATTHGSPTWEDIDRLLMYVNVVLVELLEAGSE